MMSGERSVSLLAKQTMSNFLFVIDCNEAFMAVLIVSQSYNHQLTTYLVSSKI